MRTVILAGGFGTRLSELTEAIPKPMVPIGGRPILWHIMAHYAKYGFKQFEVALGYKAEVVKEYFLNYATLNSDFSVNLATGQVSSSEMQTPDWEVSLTDTGVDALTGTRLRRLKTKIGKGTFMLTYGDGVSDVPIDKLLDFHKSHGKIATMTAVRPSARFGELTLRGSRVDAFEEKPQLQNGWINGGFFVFEPEFFDYIPDENVMLEREPLEQLAKDGELMAFQHQGFWQCMDTKRDVDMLQSIWDSGSAPWSPK